MDYLSSEFRKLGGSMDALVFAMDLAKGYNAIKIYRSERGDLMFVGRCQHFGSIERFYLDRVGYDGDCPPMKPHGEQLDELDLLYFWS